MPAASAISITAESRSPSTSIRADTRSPKGPATSQVTISPPHAATASSVPSPPSASGNAAHLGIGPHAAHAFGNRRLRLRARNAALKGVNRQQHTAGPAARRTKVKRRASIFTGTCKRCGVSGVRVKIGPTTATSAARSAQTAKIATQQLAAFIRQDPSRHVKAMIQARVGIEVIQRTQRARLGVSARHTRSAPRAR